MNNRQMDTWLLTGVEKKCEKIQSFGLAFNFFNYYNHMYVYVHYTHMVKIISTHYIFF